ncbi:hypothetical protein F5Y14DRAFT_436506 [Nemania sp. NC0429]|nr:hypothetical protein F5Y14DRAFT_436506 [Nemania sp. NC0429]
MEAGKETCCDAVRPGSVVSIVPIVLMPPLVSMVSMASVFIVASVFVTGMDLGLFGVALPLGPAWYRLTGRWVTTQLSA